MARLDLQFSDVYQAVSEHLGLGSSPTGNDLTKVKNITYRAYRQFIYPTYTTDEGRRVRHQWSWLKKRYTIVTESGKYRYSLPVDFGGMLVGPTYDKEKRYPPLTKVSCNEIDEKYSLSITSSYPYQYAINPLRGDVDQEQLWELWLWPNPNGAYNIKFVYIVSPEKPTADTDYFLGGPEAGEVILELALGIAEQQEDDLVHDHHTQMGAKLLKDMIIADTWDTPDTVGKVLVRPVHIFQYGFRSIPTTTIYFADQ